MASSDLPVISASEQPQQIPQIGPLTMLRLGIFNMGLGDHVAADAGRAQSGDD